MLAANIVLAAALLALAVYAQHRIAFHTAARRNIALTRIVLALVGFGAGWVASAYAPPGAPAMLAFAQAFGLVHVPAALILFFKRARHEGRS
jgi:FtsH-binding integral membrane protein